MRNKKLAVFILILILIMSVLLFSAKLIINIEWFIELGYIKLYFTRLISIVEILIPLFFICFIIISLFSKRLLNNIKSEIDENGLKKIKKGVLIANIIISFLISIYTSTKYWYEIVLFSNSVSFNYREPIFNLDASFYVFKLPLLKIFSNFLIEVIIITTLFSICFYTLVSIKKYFINNKFKSFKQLLDYLKEFSKKQIGILLPIFLVLISIKYVVKCFDLLYSNRGASFGASYTDINITLLFYKIIIVIAIISSIITYFCIRKNKFKISMYPFILVLFFMILEPVTYKVVYKVMVKPNEMEYESKYIGYNIDATTRAFNINNMNIKSYEPQANLNSEKISRNQETISNLKINSPSPVLNFYNQVQEIRSYYYFNDIDTDRYNIDGKYTQVFISPREISTDSMNTWQNKHLIYTHGYGVTMSRVNKVTEEGQPDFVMKNIPLDNLSNILLKNPRIYYGEAKNEYAIVDTSQEEFDYPSEKEQASYKYDDKGGIKLNIFNRLIFSLAEKDPKIVFSGAINNDSKILINRNIIERVSKIAPFLTYDDDPYIVISGGRLYWIIDAYTTSESFPYSEPHDGINYIRNSVKVTIDASSGETNYYIVDNSDPIIQSYSKIFKGLFKDKNDIPSGLKEHLKYPKKIFNLQCEVLSKYHTTDPKEFFTSEDVWEISSNLSALSGQQSTNEGLYLLTSLPGENKQQMMLFDYFNVKNKPNMVSMISVKMDESDYGKITLFKFPADKTIYGPYLFKNQILQDPDISKELSLWEGKGSKVEYGETVILPVEESLLYLLPIYLKADVDKTIPEMKKIILSDGKRIVIEDNIENGLKKLFDYKGQTSKIEKINENSQLTKEIKELYNKAMDAQTKGNWAEYGEYIKKLGEDINKLKE
ncbi:UPF0182 family protein [Clostridium sp. 'White wine YQ']|uniref:UPF0182 family protein n=1 Tax=Clostridium sp. 'White wine YQ' TaxID=3027474 RepID=UPI002366EDE6|nr:UPF0182 family protein [Clostridium sp. 'White wine YQ']MDD7796014.1 UPF0182 family protein [Clostridium sp. 'White wine YQ']